MKAFEHQILSIPTMKNWIVFIIASLAISISGLTTSSAEENRYVRSIKLAGEWFLNNQDDSFLYYQYFQRKKMHTQEHYPLREMGALWSIAELSKYLDDPRYDSLAHRGFRYFENFFKYDEKNDFCFVDIEPREMQLGYSAFMILAILKMDHPQKEYYLDKFAKGIIFLQRDDGSFRTDFFSDSSTGIDYYPGEALFALASLYEYTKDDRYLKTVEKAFPYYVGYWRDNPNTAFIPWHSRAYYGMYRLTRKREMADFVLEMNDYVLVQHSPKMNCRKLDLLKESGISVYLEGMNMAYQIARELGDKQRSECYANFIREGSDILLSLQVTDSTNFEREAIGGFKPSSASSLMRVDRNQHAVMALMDAYESGILGY
jgi:hypothetical protein